MKVIVILGALFQLFFLSLGQDFAIDGSCTGNNRPQDAEWTAAFNQLKIWSAIAKAQLTRLIQDPNGGSAILLQTKQIWSWLFVDFDTARMQGVLGMFFFF
jgi:hypothetical protein